MLSLFYAKLLYCLLHTASCNSKSINKTPTFPADVRPTPLDILVLLVRKNDNLRW